MNGHDKKKPRFNVAFDIETAPPASDFKMFSNAMYGKFAVSVPTAERGPAVCKCGVFAQIKASDEGAYCHKCGSTWSAGEAIRIQSNGIETWTGEAKDIGEFYRRQKMAKRVETIIDRLIIPKLDIGEEVIVPTVANGEAPSAKDPYSDSSLRDMLGEKDREIQALRQEVGRLSLELRRTHNAKNPKR